MRTHRHLLQAFGATKKLAPESAFGSRNVRAVWGSRSLNTAPTGKADAVTEGNSVYVVNIEGHRHTGSILIGLVDYFERHVPHVGFFQPVASAPFGFSTTGLSRHVELLHSAFEMPGDPKFMSGISRQQCVEFVARGQTDEMLDRIYKSYEKYRRNYDLVVVEGTHEDARAIGVPDNRLGLNALMAAALESPVLGVLDVKPESTAASLCNTSMIAKATMQARGASLMSIALNGADEAALPTLLRDVGGQLSSEGVWLAGGMPEDRMLSSLQLDQAANSVGATLLGGWREQLDSSATEFIVASGSLRDTLESLATAKERPLVITSSDRTDILLGLAAASMAGGPHAAGLIATNGSKLGQEVVSILNAKALVSEGQADSQPAVTLPVFVTDADDFNVITRLSAMVGRGGGILPTSLRKIEQSKVLFAKHIDGDGIAERLRTATGEKLLTPRMFMHRIQSACTAQPQRIVLPEALDARILKAAADLMRRKLAHIVLLGNAESIQAQAEKLGVDISEAQIVDPADSSDLMDRYADDLVEARKKKGITNDMARAMLADVNYFGTMMVRAGDADGMVSGAVHTTANTIRPALQVLRSKLTSIVSSVFFMLLKDKVLVFGDCAVNVSPPASDLALIASSSADTAAAFGISPPRTALLSYSTGSSGTGPEVEKVVEAVRLLRERRPDLAVEGPIQYDAAVDPAVAAVKIKGENAVAGQANVFVFPDLNTGNNTYKAVQQASGGGAIGPLMQGLEKPVNDLSRGCTVSDVIDTVLCTSLQALASKGQNTMAL